MILMMITYQNIPTQAQVTHYLGDHRIIILDFKICSANIIHNKAILKRVEMSTLLKKDTHKIKIHILRLQKIFIGKDNLLQALKMMRRVKIDLNSMDFIIVKSQLKNLKEVRFSKTLL